MTLISEVTTDTVGDLHSDLVAAYATVEADPLSAIVCPQLNVEPFPNRADLDDHLRRGLRLIRADDRSGLVLVWLIQGGKIRAAWGPKGPRIGEASFDLARFLEAEGGSYRLDVGAPGWVARQWFEDYAPQDGGPFDVSVTHPGMDAGTTYADYDNIEWALLLSGDGTWRWERIP